MHGSEKSPLKTDGLGRWGLQIAVLTDLTHILPARQAPPYLHTDLLADLATRQAPPYLHTDLLADMPTR